MHPIITIIVAIGPERLIGSKNQMPWHLPRDLRFFRMATQNHTVIMGRKTYESLGCRCLPKRKNIVITRDLDYIVRGGEIASSLEQAIELCCGEERVFVIGGGQIYRKALEYANEIYITEIHDLNPNLELFPALLTGDTYFPDIESTEWNLVRPGKRWLIAANRIPPIPASKLKRSGMVFRFMKYKRKKTSAVMEKIKRHINCP